jgi:hypothetical protein
MEIEKIAEGTNPNQSPHSPHRPRTPLRVSLSAITAALLAFLAPFGSYVVYQPINQEWTVKRFGCGCPSLDGSYHFNANDFNAIVWGVIAVVCTTCWILAARRLFPDRTRRQLCFAGSVVLL